MNLLHSHVIKEPQPEPGKKTRGDWQEPEEEVPQDEND